MFVKTLGLLTKQVASFVETEFYKLNTKNAILLSVQDALLDAKLAKTVKLLQLGESAPIVEIELSSQITPNFVTTHLTQFALVVHVQILE